MSIDERELRIFRALIKGNIARMVERAGRVTQGMGGAARTDLVKQALVLAWERREVFDPAAGVWVAWFEGLLLEAFDARDAINLTAHDWLFRYLEGDERPVRPMMTSTHAPEFGLTGTPLNLNALPRGAKDCPPCWRCRYFDGWLPGDEDDVEASSAAALEPEIAESCLRLDRNKVRIANWIRGKGWENLEDEE